MQQLTPGDKLEVKTGYMAAKADGQMVDGTLFNEYWQAARQAEEWIEGQVFEVRVEITVVGRI